MSAITAAAFLRLESGLIFYLKYLAPLAISFLILFLLARHCIRDPAWTHALMLIALVFAILLSAHDLALMAGWWSGTTIYLQPFASMLVFAAFAVAMGRRIVTAFSTVENMNDILTRNVEDAERRLKVSEGGSPP